MRTFDRDEQDIHDALSQITVDAGKLAGQVKRRLNEEIPPHCAVPGALVNVRSCSVSFVGDVGCHRSGCDTGWL